VFARTSGRGQRRIGAFIAPILATASLPWPLAHVKQAGEG
jgi:hypothetical protein